MCVTIAAVSKAEELRGRLEAFLDASVDDVRRVAGGSSRETWVFTADGERLVLRRDPPGAPARSERAAEVELLKRADEAGVPVPKVLHTDTDGEALGSPGFVMEHVDGEAIAPRILRKDEFAGARPRMAAQCGEILARLHTIPTDGLEGIERAGDDPASEAMERYREILDATGEPHPAFEIGFRWLADRKPEPDRVALVHGDFRNGNFLVGPDGVRAVLDWELAHTGDPWEDLGWLCTRSWRFGASGEVGGFGDREDLYRAYEAISGRPVDRDAVRWWEIFGSLKWGVMTMMQAFTHLWGHVRSVELAAIGRRTAECEYDLLTLIRKGG